MKNLHSYLLLAALLALGLTATAPAVFVINEIDADQTGSDSAEFVELKGNPNESASGLVLVFFNGGNSGGAGVSSFAVDLAGTADSDGYYVIGNSGVNEVQETFSGNTLQNGEDAVALYTGSASSFPNGTAVTTTGLIDFIVYEVGDDTDADWSGFGGSVTVYDEDGSGSGTTSSLGRIPDGTGTYTVATPTPGAINSAPTGPEVGLNVTDIDFGVYNADNTADPSTRGLVITNTGAGTLNVTTLQIQAGSAAQFSLDPLTSPNPDPALPAALAAGETVLLVVEFSNSDTGSDQTFTGAIEYVTDAPTGGSGTVPLTAEFVTVQETAAAGAVVINEIGYDPNPGSPDPIQDFNGDGTPDTVQDEFLELFNTTGADINIQGWEITATSGEPAIVDTEIVPAGVVIPAGGFVVFFGGGTPTGFGPGVAQVGIPALGNSGEILTISDGTTQIDDVAYEGEEGKGGFDAGVTADGGSIGRLPDGAVNFVEFPWDSTTTPPSPGLSNGTISAVGEFSLYR